MHSITRNAACKPAPGLIANTRWRVFTLVGVEIMGSTSSALLQEGEVHSEWSGELTLRFSLRLFESRDPQGETGRDHQSDSVA
jgi:hypothetical protein